MVCFRWCSFSSWWLNQPLWKIFVKMGIISPNWGEHKKYLKPQPRKWCSFSTGCSASQVPCLLSFWGSRSSGDLFRGRETWLQHAMELFENLLRRPLDVWGKNFQVNMPGEKHPLTCLPTWGGKRRVWSHFGGHVFCFFFWKSYPSDCNHQLILSDSWW